MERVGSRGEARQERREKIYFVKRTCSMSHIFLLLSLTKHMYVLFFLYFSFPTLIPLLLLLDIKFMKHNFAAIDTHTNRHQHADTNLWTHNRQREGFLSVSLSLSLYFSWSLSSSICLFSLFLPDSPAPKVISFLSFTFSIISFFLAFLSLFVKVNAKNHSLFIDTTEFTQDIRDFFAMLPFDVMDAFFIFFIFVFFVAFIPTWKEGWGKFYSELSFMNSHYFLLAKLGVSVATYSSISFSSFSLLSGRFFHFVSSEWLKMKEIKEKI